MQKHERRDNPAKCLQNKRLGIFNHLTLKRQQGKKLWSAYMLYHEIMTAEKTTKIYIPSINGHDRLVTVTLHPKDQNKAASLISRLLRRTKNNRYF